MIKTSNSFLKHDLYQIDNLKVRLSIDKVYFFVNFSMEKFMLSKNGAKYFFLIGTGFFGAIFLALAYDTLNQIPKRTNEQNLTPEVAYGKHLFDKNNCMGCHTLLGEGAYYAPELTQVYNNKGEDWIRNMLIDPELVYPGARKMVKYNMNKKDQDALVAFLKWIGEIDTNGYPAKPVNQ